MTLERRASLKDKQGEILERAVDAVGINPRTWLAETLRKLTDDPPVNVVGEPIPCMAVEKARVMFKLRLPKSYNIGVPRTRGFRPRGHQF